MPRPDLTIINANEHNLREVTLTIPRGSLTVITGLSGSGKSSLAFDTIYAEGQRRYIESLSSYARQFLGSMQRPDVEHIEGLSPAISIEQKTASRNPRSTVGTVSEIYDYLRLLYATVGQTHCPHCGLRLEGQTMRQMVERVMAWPTGTRLMVLAPIVRGRKGIYRKELHEALQAGFLRARINGEMRMLDQPITLDRQKKHHIEIVIDRIVLAPEERPRLESAIDTALRRSEGLVTVDVLPWEDAPAQRRKSASAAASARPAGYPDAQSLTFSESLACPEHGPQLLELTPRIFSFNSPYGWCQACKGLGHLPTVDERGLVPDDTLSIAEGAIAPWEREIIPSPLTEETRSKKGKAFRALCKENGADLNTPWHKLSAEARKAVLEGVVATGKAPEYEGPARVLQRWLDDESLDEELRAALEEFTTPLPCAVCHGTRLKPEALAVRVRGQSIAQAVAMPIVNARRHFEAIQWSEREWLLAQQMIHEIRDRLRFLDDVGVGYLTLERGAGTLAGGELQRIRLATQIGSQLTGVLYVLDEPSIGLHMRDNDRLIQALGRLRDMGNTVIVVEHDEATMRAADYLIDLGPGAGRHGGRVMAAGIPAHVLAHPDSLTARFLSGAESIAVPKKRRPVDPKRSLVVRGASANNLANVDVAIPLGCFVCVTGVSGSGKSSLVEDILHPALSRKLGLGGRAPAAHAGLDGAEHLDKVIDVDQSPIGRTPRSNTATYTGVFTHIRDLFSNLPDARMHGWKPGHFSFNVVGGRCEHCKGAGSIKLEMAFLPEVYVTCEVCRGARYNSETLTAKYRDKSIAEVLDMPVGEALEFFQPVPRIAAILQTIHDVGLDYITLGQAATTLSGGEAQRIKLGRELSRRGTGRTLYILDEPTTGLHFEDIRKLVGVLQRLVDAGNTVLVVEHNLDVAKCADWIIDLGPEGGDGGGRLVAEGTPEKIAATPGSHTGRFLKPLLPRK